MFSSQIDGYVCLTCGVAIERPTTDSGHLRCPDGHFVDGVKSGPLWATAVNSHFLALLPLAAIAVVLRGHWTSWIVLSGFVVWSAYMFVLGVLLPRDQVEIRAIATQFMVTAAARVVAVIAVGLYLLL